MWLSLLTDVPLALDHSRGCVPFDPMTPLAVYPAGRRQLSPMQRTLHKAA